MSGLVSGACFSDFGHQVICIDKDADKIASLDRGVMPIFEPGLAQLVAKNVAAGRLSFTTDINVGVADAEAVFIGVGTPSRRGDGHADLSYVFAAAREIAQAVQARAKTGEKHDLLLVTKSTVPVGTGDEVEKIVRAECSDCTIHVASNPEFLREGAAIEDFKRPDRVVCGTDHDVARDMLRQIYRPLSLNQSAPVLFTGRRTAELIKYAANAFLATKISFINEIADLCEATGADVQEVSRGIGLDKRIGAKFLHAGPGYGGSCFPKDTLALLKTAEEYDAPLRIVEAVVTVNDARKRAMGAKVVRALGGDAQGKIVAVLGLTFKPNTDDMRDSPAIPVIEALQAAGATVRACDPEGVEQASRLLSDIAYLDDPYQAAEGADVVVIATEWDAYRALDLTRLAETDADAVDGGSAQRVCRCGCDARGLALRGHRQAGGGGLNGRAPCGAGALGRAHRG